MNQARGNWRPGQPIRFETPRFYLRSLRPQDANEEYVSWWNDPEIQRGFGSSPRNFDRAKASRHIATFNNRNKFHLGIFSKKNDKMIGFFTIVFQPGKVAATNICVGNKSYWGEDILLEIKTVALEFVFGVMNMEKAESRIYGRNLSSIYTNKVMGFKPEAVVRKHVPGPEGKRLDVYVFGLLKDEWPEAKQKSLKALRAKARLRAAGS